MSTFSSGLNDGILNGMDIYQIRKANLIKLIGSQRKSLCAQRWGMSPAHLSQILSDRTPKNLGDDVARRIESSQGLPHGWLDTRQSDSEGEPSAAKVDTSTKSSSDIVRLMLEKHGRGLSDEARERIVAAAIEPDEEPAGYLPANLSSLRPRQEEILIPQYDVRAAMGHGQVPADYNEAIRNLIVREEVLREKGVSYTSTAALAVITGWGQSMEGTINDKDPLIVDRGVNEFIGDGLYVLTWHGLLYIKRVQVIDAEHYRLISDNQHYENQTARADDVTIHAKVLLIWNMRKA